MNAHVERVACLRQLKRRRRRRKRRRRQVDHVAQGLGHLFVFHDRLLFLLLTQDVVVLVRGALVTGRVQLQMLTYVYTRLSQYLVLHQF